MHHHRSPSCPTPDRGIAAKRPARHLAAILLPLVVGIALVGCSGDSGDDASSEGASGLADSAQPESGPASSSSADPDDAAWRNDGSGAGGSGDELTATGAVVPRSAPEAVDGSPSAAATARMQTFVADLDLGVDQLDDAVAEASAAIEELGGFAADEDIDLTGSDAATVVYRVPAAEFRPALGALADIGALRRQSIASEDVTARSSDLESRVTTLRTSITRLRGFLGETTDVTQIAPLESELTRREAELESIEAQRRVLADQVALSTITVEFDATRRSEQVVADDRPGFRGGLDAGREAAAVVLAAAAATAGFLVPLLPLIAVVALVGWWILRRRRRGSASAVAATE